MATLQAEVRGNSQCTVGQLQHRLPCESMAAIRDAQPGVHAPSIASCDQAARSLHHVCCNTCCPATSMYAPVPNDIGCSYTHQLHPCTCPAQEASLKAANTELLSQLLAAQQEALAAYRAQQQRGTSSAALPLILLADVLQPTAPTAASAQVPRLPHHNRKLAHQQEREQQQRRQQQELQQQLQALVQLELLRQQQEQDVQLLDVDDDVSRVICEKTRSADVHAVVTTLGPCSKEGRQLVQQLLSGPAVLVPDATSGTECTWRSSWGVALASSMPAGLRHPTVIVCRQSDQQQRPQPQQHSNASSSTSQAQPHAYSLQAATLPSTAAPSDPPAPQQLMHGRTMQRAGSYEGTSRQLPPCSMGFCALEQLAPNTSTQPTAPETAHTTAGHVRLPAKMPAQLPKQLPAQLLTQLPAQLSAQLAAQRAAQLAAQLTWQSLAQLPRQRSARWAADPPAQLPVQLAAKQDAQLPTPLPAQLPVRPRTQLPANSLVQLATHAAAQLPALHVPAAQHSNDMWARLSAAATAATARAAAHHAAALAADAADDAAADAADDAAGDAAPAQAVGSAAGGAALRPAAAPGQAAGSAAVGAAAAARGSDAAALAFSTADGANTSADAGVCAGASGAALT